MTGYFLHPTTSVCESSCPNGYYEDSGSRTCPQCSTGCLTCTTSGTSSCPSCSPQYYAPSINQCAACDGLCNECSGAGNGACDACAADKYSVENTSLTCVAQCSDHAPNYYLDDPICKKCDDLCATCTASTNAYCSSCAANTYSVETDPGTCVADCSDHAANYYLDDLVCKECHS